MSAIIAPAPVGAPALLVLLIGLVAFAAALLFVRARLGDQADADADATVRIGSRIGICLQGAGFLLAALGPVNPALQTESAAAVGQAVLVALLIGTCIGMFLSAALAMGRNWSLAARTRSDHDLVTWGPFAKIRHPIYTGLLAMLLAVMLALGHWWGLLVGLPLFAIGTWIRVREEERLLHARFGRHYEAYAARVKRFVPGFF